MNNDGIAVAAVSRRWSASVGSSNSRPRITAMSAISSLIDKAAPVFAGWQGRRPPNTQEKPGAHWRRLRQADRQPLRRHQELGRSCPAGFDHRVAFPARLSNDKVLAHLDIAAHGGEGYRPDGMVPNGMFSTSPMTPMALDPILRAASACISLVTCRGATHIAPSCPPCRDRASARCRWNRTPRLCR